MAEITPIKESQTYEVMNLWLRATTHANPFVEQDFWKNHYEVVKDKYINEQETFVYMDCDTIMGFVCITDDNMIGGLFVDPEYQNKGIGTELLNYLKEEYALLQIKIYANNRKAFKFATNSGFIIDGAIRHEHNNEIMYTMLWNE